jgi:DNA-binding CsgD family transcriptional regulator
MMTQAEIVSEVASLRARLAHLEQEQERRQPEWGKRPTANVLASDSEAEVRARIECLRDRFGLTKAEAAFALEIVKGDGRQAAADRLGISVATARSHLSRIFDKTGSRRQAELVHQLLQK